MKNIFKIVVVSFFMFNIITAQTVTMTVDNDSSEVPGGGYYQDTNNSLNQFVGTWVYTGTNETITIKLRKVTHTFSARIYEDLLIGEYSLVRNGVVLINTFSNFNIDLPDQTDHAIYGNMLDKNIWTPKCNECQLTRVSLTYKDELTTALGRLTFGLLASDPNQAKIQFYNSGKSYTATDPHDIRTYQTTQHTNTIPNNWYIFIKQ